MISREHAVVVGGTRGLGRVVAKNFLMRGYNVTLLSRRPPSNSPLHSQHISVDLEKFSGFKKDEIDQFRSYGPIRYLVLAQRYRGIADSWHGEIQVSLTASRIIIEELLKQFVTAGDSAIVAASSVYAQLVGGSQPIGYHVAKAGVNAMCRYYAWSLGAQNIRVNSIMPLSYIKDEAREFYTLRSDLQEIYSKFVPLRRMGNAEDAADIIDFLCSDKARFITGQSIFVDGGVSIVWPEETVMSINNSS